LRTDTRGFRIAGLKGPSIADAAMGCRRLERFEKERDMWGEAGNLGGFDLMLVSNSDGLPGIVGRSKVSLRGEAVGSSNSNVLCTGDVGAEARFCGPYCIPRDGVDDSSDAVEPVLREF
jgi:hypothetical protein